MGSKRAIALALAPKNERGKHSVVPLCDPTSDSEDIGSGQGDQGGVDPIVAGDQCCDGEVCAGPDTGKRLEDGSPSDCTGGANSCTAEDIGTGNKSRSLDAMNASRVDGLVNLLVLHCLPEDGTSGARVSRACIGTRVTGTSCCGAEVEEWPDTVLTLSQSPCLADFSDRD